MTTGKTSDWFDGVTGYLLDPNDQTMAFASRNVKSPCKGGGPSSKKLYQDFVVDLSKRYKVCVYFQQALSEE